MHLKILQADVSHTAAIATIGKKSFRDAFEHLFKLKEELFEYLEHTYDPVKLAQSIRKENNVYLLAFTSGQPVGFAKLKKHSLNDQIEPGAQMELQKIYILPGRQGYGVGTSLLKEVRKIAREIHPDYIWLDTYVNNGSAIRLYEKNGYKKMGNCFLRSVRKLSNIISWHCLWLLK
jgi:ribosomal protein S18 acetylase RimI-like enzyme